MTPKQITIGRLLNKQGNPIPNTGITIQSSSATVQLLQAQTNAVLFANPITKEIGVVVHVATATGEKVAKGLAILPPGGSGPPMHMHPLYEEIFEVVDGSFEFRLGKKTLVLTAGEKIVVKPNTSHTFRPLGISFSAFLVETKPKGRLNEVVHTIFGLAIEGKLNAKGQPGFWQGIAIGTELANDTLFTNPPPFIQKLLFLLLGKTASKKGYKGMYEKYMTATFWEQRVEQLNAMGVGL